MDGDKNEPVARARVEKTRRPYESPRVLTDEAFEQISLACSMKMGVKKNLT